MRRSRAVLSIVIAGLFCLMLPCATLAATKNQLNEKLIDAVWNNDLAAAQRAVGEGAEPTATDDKGLSAIDIAVDKGFFEIAHYLLAAQNQQIQTPAKPEPAAAPATSATPVAVPRAPVETTALKPKPDAANSAPAKSAPVPPLVAPLDRRLVYEEPEPILVLPEITRQPEPVAESAPGTAAITASEARPASPRTELPPSPKPVATASEPSQKQTSAAAVSSDQNPEPSQIPAFIARLGDLFAPAEPPPAPEPLSALDELELAAPEVSAAPADAPVAIPENPAVSRPTETQPPSPASQAETTKPVLSAEQEEPPVKTAPSAQPAPVISEPPPQVALSRTASSPQMAAASVQPAAPKSPSPTFLERIGDFFSSSSPQTSAVPPQTPTTPSPALEELELARPETAALPKGRLQTEPRQRTGSKAGSPEPVNASDASGPVAEVPPQSADPSPVAASSETLPETTEPEIDTRSNPFTRLTDLILDLLPDAPDTAGKSGDEIKAEPEKQDATAASANSATAEREKQPVPSVAYPVKDLTAPEDPYKVTQPSPLVVESAPPPPTDAPAAAVEEARVIGPSITIPRPPARPEPKTLREEDLSYGETGYLNTPMDQAGISGENCVVKKTWQSHFCIQSFQWAPEMMQALGLPGFYQGGGLAIVHYKNGKSVQYHGLFPAQSFDRISEYLITKYGEPSARPETWTAMLAEPNRQNRVYQWISKARQGGADLILEIREIDDLRWSTPPDKFSGVIRLYRKGDDTIFRLLTSADLLLLQVRKGNDPPSPPPVKSR